MVAQPKLPIVLHAFRAMYYCQIPQFVNLYATVSPGTTLMLKPKTVNFVIQAAMGVHGMLRTV